MNTLQSLLKDDKTVRTQITLTDKLKSVVEEHASSVGESLSEYLRKAAMIRMKMEGKQKKHIDDVLKKVIGSLKNTKNPNWKDKKSIYTWSRKIREEW